MTFDIVEAPESGVIRQSRTGEIRIALFPAAVIGIVAFLFTILGLKFGVKIGAGREGKFELIGGIVLVCIGAKILVSG